MGIEAVAAPFRLRLEDDNLEEMALDLGERLLVLAPGSGSPEKNWPLSSYYEVARTLAWEGGLRVLWLAGPAEEPLLPYIQGLAAAQEQAVWVGEPLGRVARLLSRTHLYLGGDSGLTHLAAAAGARRVVALFGPTDPRVWAPLGEQVMVLTPPGGAGEKAALARLSPETVLGRLRGLLG
jgi:ADP-heptose:LPS heptosyltransferase